MLACHCIVGIFFLLSKKKNENKRKKALQSSPCYWLSFFSFSFLFFYLVFDPFRLLNSGWFVWIFPEVINLLYLLLLLFLTFCCFVCPGFLLNAILSNRSYGVVGGKPLCETMVSSHIFFVYVR